MARFWRRRITFLNLPVLWVQRIERGCEIDLSRPFSRVDVNQREDYSEAVNSLVTSSYRNRAHPAVSINEIACYPTGRRRLWWYCGPPLREGPWHPIRVLDFNTFRWNNASYIYMPVLITASRMRCHHLDACCAHPKKTQKKNTKKKQ